MNYDNLTDFEINKKVLAIEYGFTPLSYAHDADKRSAGTVDVSGFLWYDFCNDWRDGGPIIEKYGIALGYDGISWEASCMLRNIPPYSDWKNYPESPLRLAMIVFLKIQEVKEIPFNFDLEQMKRAVESPSVEVPAWALEDAELFNKWLAGEFGDEQ